MLNFLTFFEFVIQQGNKHTNLNYQKIEKFIIFSIYQQSRKMPTKRDKQIKKNANKKRQVDKKKTTWIEFNHINNGKEYKVGKIQNSELYTNKLDAGHVLKLDYLVF